MLLTMGWIAVCMVLVIFDPLPRWQARRRAQRPIDDIERFERIRAAIREVTGR